MIIKKGRKKGRGSKKEAQNKPGEGKTYHKLRQNQLEQPNIDDMKRIDSIQRKISLNMDELVRNESSFNREALENMTKKKTSTIAASRDGGKMLDAMLMENEMDEEMWDEDSKKQILQPSARQSQID